ncbi:MAG TPA: PAS domain-containing protein [Bdellovibrionota bacterium]|nr:PAS domain-containing protein [Bdellovibrionota bacterium]
MDPVDKINILLVDDVPANLVALTAILDDPSYNLVTALSGAEALKQLLHSEFALILLDVMMPGMDGFETARTIKQRGQTRHTPIIFVTAVARDAKDAYQGYALGAVDYIQKPLDSDIVRGKVAVFVDLFRKKQEIQRQAELIRNSERAQFLEREQAARLRAEQAERRFRGLVNALDHAIIWEARPDLSTLTFVSDRVEALLGYPHHKWLEDPEFFLSVVHPDDRARLLRILLKAVGDGGDDGMGERCEHRMVGADGIVRWFHTGIERLQEPGMPLRVRGLTVDINPLKGVEHALRDSQERLEFALGAAQMGMWDWNLITGSLVWSETLQRIFGYVPGEFPGNIDGFWDRLHPEDSERVRKAMRDSFDNKIDFDIEYRALWRDGSEHWIHSKGRAFRDSSQKVIRMSGTALEITQRKRIETEKSALFTELERAIQAREELVAVVAHDLRNPLTAIQLSCDLIIRKLPRPAPEAVEIQVKRMKRTANRMSQLMQDILDLSKVESGRFTIAPKADNVQRLVAETIDLFQPLAAERRIRLASSVSPGCCEIFCDHGRVLQVLSNLVSNAIKYSPGRGTVEIKAQASHSHETLVSVVDHGPGIKPDDLPNLFNRFWQGKDPKATGTGLGLYISKGIIEAHGGKIWAEPNPAGGLIVCFTLPTKAPKSEETAA